MSGIGSILRRAETARRAPAAVPRRRRHAAPETTGLDLRRQFADNIDHRGRSVRVMMHNLPPSGFLRINVRDAMRERDFVTSNRSCRRHHREPGARPPIARRAQGLAPKPAGRGRQRDRNTFACAPMSMLRRPDDHRRDIRRRAARAVFIAEPDQDRHLMIDVALLSASQRRSLSPPAARRSRKATSSQGHAKRRDEGAPPGAAETEQAYALKLTAAGLNAVGADARGQLVGRDARVDRTAQAPLGRQILHRGGFPSDAPCAVLAQALASPFRRSLP